MYIRWTVLLPQSDDAVRWPQLPFDVFRPVQDLPSMPQAQGRYQQAAIPHHDKEVRDQNGQVQITSTRKQKRHYYEHHTPNQQHQRYQQQRHSQPSSRATDVAYRGHESPTDSAAGSMASTFRRDENSRDIQRVPSEDGMGSVLGTIAGSDYSHNQDLHWRRSALKKFNKVSWHVFVNGRCVYAER